MRHSAAEVRQSAADLRPKRGNLRHQIEISQDVAITGRRGAIKNPVCVSKNCFNATPPGGGSGAFRGTKAFFEQISPVDRRAPANDPFSAAACGGRRLYPQRLITSPNPNLIFPLRQSAPHGYVCSPHASGGDSCAG
jgi:hypothetical protein